MNVEDFTLNKDDNGNEFITFAKGPQKHGKEDYDFNQGLYYLKCRPVAGEGAGGARAPPEIFGLELNSATKMEFFY